MRVSGDRELGPIKIEQVTEGWSQLSKQERNNLFCSPNSIMPDNG
jgi:hypothetical protein